MSRRSWDREFDDPVEGFSSLRDAAQHIMSLPKAEQQREHWQTAADMLMKVAEREWPMMFAEIGMLKALNHGKPVPDKQPRRKTVKTYRILR